MTKAIYCPGCGQRVSAAHLRDSPGCMAAAHSFVGVYTSAKRRRVGKSTGRPKVMQPCPRCGQQVGTVEARYGHEGCRTGSNDTTAV